MGSSLDSFTEPKRTFELSDKTVNWKLLEEMLFT